MSKRILVVDDEEAIQELIQIYLSELDVKIYPALSGEEGLEKYTELMKKEKKADLVIMNLKLPGMDGVETTKKIMQVNPDALIYGFTASFGTGWAEELKKAGAKSVIPRTVGFDAFREIVKKILEGEEVEL
ncbi:MAG: response regulator [Candidatus Thermoplasmatota archaeon]|nr:response regulator [Candidatus Thermoplasmatota archaeon]